MKSLLDFVWETIEGAKCGIIQIISGENLGIVRQDKSSLIRLEIHEYHISLNVENNSWEMDNHEN